ncbi:hypothetical protein LCGC14_1412400 [marine sediment metagenome]|uniref:NAD-dependent epimerase/dehydratase domain-containing protein n=1 Tax=marine sediment metagenome TaxID=412755 RepID=A0A0F9MVI7_9ZZZZ
MRILVTGSEGRLCKSILIPYLKRFTKYEIIPFDLILGHNMLDYDSVMQKLDGVDVVIHAAGVAGPMRAKRKTDFAKINTNGTKNMLECSAKASVGKFIFFSSMSYYGTDAWMRYRRETGAIKGEDVAVPLYLPIDEDHPSILTRDCDKLTEYNGKYYGMSKAKVYEMAKSGDFPFDFISLRFAGFTSTPFRKIKSQLELMKKEAAKGIVRMRKHAVYRLSGITTNRIMKAAIRAVLEGKTEEKVSAFNTCEVLSLGNAASAYFPGVPQKKNGYIFSNEKLLNLFNEMKVKLE